MEEFTNLKFILLLVILFFTALIVNIFPSDEANQKEVRIAQYLTEIPNWKANSKIQIEKRILDVLELDEYFYNTYSNGELSLTLYVGYYFRNSKVGAAHDPLVCFPGQGWKVNNKQRERMLIGKNPAYKVDYSNMVAELGPKKEFVVYWFQANDKAHNSTFQQKKSLFLQKLKGRKGESAFVRITIAMIDNDVKKYDDIAKDFIASFYPRFIDYVNN